MRRIYTEEQKKYIEKIVPGHSIHDAAQMVSEKFGFEMTDSMMQSYMKNHRLKNGLGHSVKRPCYRVFSKEVQEFISTNVKGISNMELTEMVNKKFGTNYKVEQISSYKKNHNLNSGLDGRFKKGNIPANKGIKGIHVLGTEKTWFKKGNLQRHREVGSERINVDGYVEIKVAEPSIWKLKHVMVYEKAHGKVPDDCKVIFLDKNKLNLSIENLKAVTREELLEMNRNKLFFKDDPGRTETGALIAKVTCAARKLIKK